MKNFIQHWVDERTIKEKVSISGTDIYGKEVTETLNMRRPKNNFVRFVAWLFLRDKFITISSIQFKSLHEPRDL